MPPTARSHGGSFRSSWCCGSWRGSTGATSALPSADVSDLKFSETVYGLGAGIFFLGYFFFEVPSNLLLEKIGARKTIARITILWGICCIAMMFVTTPGMFYLLRFLLGVFEAGFYPGVILFLTSWYPTERRAKAFRFVLHLVVTAGAPRRGVRLVHVGVRAGRRHRRPHGRNDHDGARRRERLGRLA